MHNTETEKRHVQPKSFSRTQCFTWFSWCFPRGLRIGISRMVPHNVESGIGRFAYHFFATPNLTFIIQQAFNSHCPPADPPTPRATKKSDSLCKLYDMDENPERRGWLDKLLSFMDERRTPITACPTISKQPLDLYKLYLLVKERGGFVEVCKVP